MLLADLHKQTYYVSPKHNSLFSRTGSGASAELGIELGVGFHFYFTRSAHKSCPIVEASSGPLELCQILGAWGPENYVLV